FSLLIRRPSCSTLFPYTTLFRSFLHDRDAVPHRHRLDLVVRHVDERRTEVAVQLLQVDARLHAELGIEVGERLVQEEHLRAADEDRKSTRLNSSHVAISYAVFCL